MGRQEFALKTPRKPASHDFCSHFLLLKRTNESESRKKCMCVEAAHARARRVVVSPTLHRLQTGSRFPANSVKRDAPVECDAVYTTWCVSLPSIMLRRWSSPLKLTGQVQVMDVCVHCFLNLSRKKLSFLIMGKLFY